jgi:hypothetical protein
VGDIRCARKAWPLRRPARVLRQVTALTRWVGAGRQPTQTGQLTMADARHLVGLLDTGVVRAAGPVMFVICHYLGR